VIGRGHSGAGQPPVSRLVPPFRDSAKAADAPDDPGTGGAPGDRKRVDELILN